MAELVIGIATSHLTHVLEFPDQGDPAQVAAFRGGFERLGAALQEASVDAVIVLAGEHVNHFFLENLPAFCIGVMPSVAGPVEARRRWMGVPYREVPGAEALAAYLLERGLAGGVDWAFSEHWVIDHGMMLPLYLMDPQAALPVVPVFINCAVPPLPSIRRCYAVGRWIRDAVEAWPRDARVALVATGGLSHAVGTPEMGIIDEAFDREVLECICGDPSRLQDLPDERVRAAGNATAEIRSWAALAGAFSDRPAELVFYAPIAGFGTGCGQVLFPSR